MPCAPSGHGDAHALSFEREGARFEVDQRRERERVARCQGIRLERQRDRRPVGDGREQTHEDGQRRGVAGGDEAASGEDVVGDLARVS